MNANVRMMTDMAIMIAVATILGFIEFDMPWLFGGSVSLEMLPIVLIALRYGLKAGLITGFLYGVVDFLLEPVYIHPVQLLLDYPVAFMMVGFAGLFKLRPDQSRLTQGTTIVTATLLAVCLRFLSHFFSALIWFGQFAPEGMSVWTYAALYNVSYLLPSFLLVSVALVFVVLGAPRLVYPDLKKEVKV